VKNGRVEKGVGNCAFFDCIKLGLLKNTQLIRKGYV